MHAAIDLTMQIGEVDLPPPKHPYCLSPSLQARKSSASLPTLLAEPALIFNDVTLGIKSDSGFALVYDWTIVTFLSPI
jgi:hypothetical protein